ncbi:MAG: NfeD family protein [Acetivibrionales bacterium]|jgi:membrane-bound ClpP family serine protease
MGLSGFVSNIGVLQTLCLILGLALVTFEMFNPGFGIPGITGLVLLVAGVILTAKTVLEAFVMIIILVAIIGLLLMFALRSATKGRLSKTLVLSDSLNTASGYIGTEELSSYMGKEGIAITNLRPSGTAVFGDVKLDVVSDGGYIPKDTKVKVVHVSGRRVAVREIQ